MDATSSSSAKESSKVGEEVAILEEERRALKN